MYFSSISFREVKVFSIEVNLLHLLYKRRGRKDYEQNIGNITARHRDA